MVKTFLIVFIVFYASENNPRLYLPIRTSDRQSINSVSLTNIGQFGLLRKERPGVPAHYHTGIDIKRPAGNYKDEPIFSIYDGIVISIRKDGPYAQIIIEHRSTRKFWTVYEHVAGIKVSLNELVTPELPIARFMNIDELDKYGWQFDHFHFEILKTRPVALKYDPAKPERRYVSYSLTCLTREKLNKHFYDPMEFFNMRF